MQISLSKKPKLNLKKDLIAWVIAIPSLILFVFFIWGPLIQNIGYSFFKTRNFDLVEFTGFDNYIAVLNDPRFAGALQNTLLYVLYSLLIGFFIPIILALVISEVVRSKSLFKIGFYIPNIVPAVAVILMWKYMMDANDYGFFNIILYKLGLPTSGWISDPNLSIPMIILTLTWKSAGSTMLIYLATIQSIDASLYEAARIKGFSVWKRLRYITLPALFSNIKLLLIIQIISIFQIFYEPMIFMGNTNDQANTLGLLIYKLIYTSNNTGQAAALGVITMFILLIFTYVYLYFDAKTKIDRQKEKVYTPLSIVEERFEKRQKTWYYRMYQSIIIGFKYIGKGVYLGLKYLGILYLLNLIKRGFNYLTSYTKKITLPFFKSKHDGILTYSDYKKGSRRLGYYLMYICLIGGLLAVLIPFLWLFFTSFKAANELLVLPDEYVFFPKTIDFAKYVNVIESTQIMKNVLNSTIIALGAAFCAILFNGLLAYVVSILKPKGSKVIFYLVLASMLIPSTVALVPLYRNIIGVYEFIASITGMSLRKVQSTIVTLIPFWLIAGASPFNFLLFKSHFDSLPKDLFEVAELEGSTHLKTFFKVVVPLSVPVMMVVGIFSMTGAWNDFLLPYVVINNQDFWTVMIKIFKINAEMYVYGITLDQFLALLLFTMVPPVIIFFIFQKQITSNVATTGIK